MKLTLADKWPTGQFRRSLRDKDGKQVKTLLFEQGKATTVTNAQAQTLREDIGNVLWIASVRDDGLVKCDPEATDRHLGIKVRVEGVKHETMDVLPAESLAVG